MFATASCSRRLGDLRGVQWRIHLGILPSSPPASIDDLRRVVANSRRRYAALRRQLLVDPHVPKDGSSSPDHVMDNPLSQNPDSMWGQFFRNAELERMVDQDLTRLYPERGSYFQTSGCQVMLRRILLLWCLRHPNHGYRQGMHELLAPLLYVLQADVKHLSEVRKIYDSHYGDKFDGFSFHENDLSYKFDFKKFSEIQKFKNSPSKASIDPQIQMIVSLTDAYGAEGELGIVSSEKFIEHDAYCMFDSLMTGASGAVSMAEFFSPSLIGNSHSGFPPVIEASAALYHLLSVVDPSLHSHLVELGVEPQYFALRWLRVLFGREFSLEDLLVIWDEIFSRENTNCSKGVMAKSSFEVLESPRGAFIVAFAVSMMLHLRSSLLATENATTCLQKLLNFPGDVTVVNVLEKAKSLHSLAVDVNISNPVPTHYRAYDGRDLIIRADSVPLDSTFPGSPLCIVPDSYWEQKWRVLHREHEKGTNHRRGWSERAEPCLYRTESDPFPSKQSKRTKIPRLSVRRVLLKDLARQLGSDEDEGNTCDEVSDHLDAVEVNGESGDGNEENICDSAIPSSPIHGHDNENESERSFGLASINGNDAESCGAVSECGPVPVYSLTDGLSSECTENDDLAEKQEVGIKERKLVFGMFQWMLKFGRNAGEGTSELASAHTPDETANVDNISSGKNSDSIDHNLMGSLKNLGNSMLENIQVIESVFQQDRVQIGSSEKNGLVSKGQVTAMSALKELRKISNLLSEM